MEAAGLAVGAVALASLFSEAVQCFEYVQLGRNFGKSFQPCQLKLDVARLQLSRWGQSLGLDSMNDAQTLQQTRLAAQGIHKAEEILGHILDLFADAERVSERHRIRAPHSDQSLAVHDPAADLDPTPLSLHEKMRELTIRRQGQTGLRQKVKWALYKEKEFSRLIEDIGDLVQSLIDLFPAATATQRKLCESEVSELATKDSLPMLKEVAEDQDTYLKDAISRAIGQPANNSYYITFSGSHNTGFQLGTNTGTIRGFQFGTRS